jgi:hypothetical protein
MRPSSLTHFRRVALLIFCLPAALLAQTSQLPITSSTSAAPAAPIPTAPQSHRADVTFSDGLLFVSATNASLNQVIREIARQTGMHISGSIAEDRVFGTYGPSTPSTILSTLLDGTGSNILLVDATPTTPAQLVLTPRTGAPTPPNPNAQSQENANNTDLLPGAQQPHPVSPAPTASQPASTAPNGGQPTSTTQTGVFPPIGTTSTPATFTSTPADPNQPANGVKTPQQIFEQLQRLRQQQTQTQ